MWRYRLVPSAQATENSTFVSFKTIYFFSLHTFKIFVFDVIQFYYNVFTSMCRCLILILLVNFYLPESKGPCHSSILENSQPLALQIMPLFTNISTHPRFFCISFVCILGMLTLSSMSLSMFHIWLCCCLLCFPLLTQVFCLAIHLHFIFNDYISHLSKLYLVLIQISWSFLNLLFLLTFFYSVFLFFKM